MIYAVRDIKYLKKLRWVEKGTFVFISKFKRRLLSKMREENGLTKRTRACTRLRDLFGPVWAYPFLEVSQVVSLPHGKFLSLNAWLSGQLNYCDNFLIKIISFYYRHPNKEMKIIDRPKTNQATKTPYQKKILKKLRGEWCLMMITQTGSFIFIFISSWQKIPLYTYRLIV